MSVITTGLTITSSYGSWYFGELPIRGDSASITQFCTEKGYALTSYSIDSAPFSNDGGRLMNYYGEITYSGTTESKWMNLFGYDSILTSVTE